jgi:hypothetical protein
MLKAIQGYHYVTAVVSVCLSDGPCTFARLSECQVAWLWQNYTIAPTMQYCWPIRWIESIFWNISPTIMPAHFMQHHFHISTMHSRKTRRVDYVFSCKLHKTNAVSLTIEINTNVRITKSRKSRMDRPGSAISRKPMYSRFESLLWIFEKFERMIYAAIIVHVRIVMGVSSRSCMLSAVSKFVGFCPFQAPSVIRPYTARVEISLSNAVNM